jgi:hypothetical protein
VSFLLIFLSGVIIASVLVKLKPPSSLIVVMVFLRCLLWEDKADIGPISVLFLMVELQKVGFPNECLHSSRLSFPKLLKIQYFEV